MHTVLEDDATAVHSLNFCADLKGELNVDKKWQSDDLFYMIMNEIRPRVDRF